jgi:hypothetical protein
MNPRIVNGWLVIDLDASDQTSVEIAIFSNNAKAFLPAFRDYENGKRVAKVRVGSANGRAVVYVRVDGVESMAGNLVI